MKKNSKIKYLVFDLDDTLLKKDRTISSYTIEILKRAQKEGLKVVFDTSRSLQHSKKYADQIGIDYGIYSGGCQIVDKNEKELFSRTISKEKVKEITKFLASKGSTISVQTKTTFYASDVNYKAQNAVHIDFKDGLEEEAFKVLCFSMDFKFVEDLANKFDLEWQNYLNGGWHRLSLKGANKWNGILEFLKIVGGKSDEVAAFGDDFGDMEMIEKSGCGVAMANSQKEVLAVAPNIALSNDEDGCAHFIEDNIL